MGNSRVWVAFFIVLAFAAVSSARNPLFFTSEGNGVGIGGRSLKVMLTDYGEPVANRGHDPPSFRNKGGSGGRS